MSHTVGFIKFGEADYVQLAGIFLIILGLILIGYNAFKVKTESSYESTPGNLCRKLLAKFLALLTVFVWQ